MRVLTQILAATCAFTIGDALAQTNPTAEHLSFCQEAQAADRAGGYVVPGRSGWLFYGDEFRREFVTNIERFTLQIAELSQKFKAEGVNLILVPLATRPIIQSDKLDSSIPVEKAFDYLTQRKLFLKMLSEFKSEKVNVVDLLTPLLSDAGSGGENLHFKSDQHWTPEGARIASKFIADEVRNLSDVSQLTKGVYKTNLIDSIEYVGEYQYFITDACKENTTYGYNLDRADAIGDILNKYSTTNTQESLLDDTSNQIVLAGDSHSKADYNLAGFLEDQLQSNVLNVSVTGGGSNAALMGYLLSDAYLKEKPKFIIWEFAINVFNPDRISFREISASIKPPCQSNDAILTKTTNLQTGSTAPQTILSVGSGQEFNPRNTRLIITTTNPVIDKLNLNINYANGETENVILNHFRVTSPIFTFDFSPKINSTIKNISLVPLTSSTATIETRVCSGS